MGVSRRINEMTFNKESLKARANFNQNPDGIETRRRNVAPNHH